MGLKIGKFYQFIQSYGPSFMTKFCSALLYLENLLTNIFAKLNLRGGVSCMPAALLFVYIFKPFFSICCPVCSFFPFLRKNQNLFYDSHKE